MAGSVAVLPDGLRLWVDTTDRHIAGHAIAGRYELNELDFVRRAVRPGGHVLDVGAHIGIFTVRMASLVGPGGSVTAIEPLPRHVGSLRRSLAASGLAGRVRVVRAAATDVSGTRELIVAAPGLASANAWLRPAALASAPDATTLRVATVRVDDVVVRRPISFVRLDVEGAEGLALHGASEILTRDRPSVLAELHPHLLPHVSDMDARDCLEFMAGLGYRCHRLAAGVPGAEITDVPEMAVASVIFLPADRR